MKHLMHRHTPPYGMVSSTNTKTAFFLSPGTDRVGTHGRLLSCECSSSFWLQSNAFVLAGRGASCWYLERYWLFH